MLVQLLFLALAPLALATSCRSAIDQLNPIRASSVLKLLESAELQQAVAGEREEGTNELADIANALEAKIVWDIPASKEAEVADRFAALFPKV